MIPFYPPNLPRPNRQGYQEAAQEVRLRSKNDAGPKRTRLLSSTAADPVALSMTVDRNGKQEFDNFYRVTTSRGALPFWMPDPTLDGWQMTDENGVPLLDGDGTPLLFSALWLCMFGDSTPTEQIQGVEFVINFTVEVMP